MATSDAPLQIGRVVLTVNDLAKVGDFYQDTIGLQHLSGDAAGMVLGADGAPLLELRRDAAARFRPQEAGLFHTAFLLPDRRALGSWLRWIAETQTSLDGATWTDSFSALMSPRWATPASLMAEATIFWMSGGRPRQARPLAMNQKPSQIWFEIAQFFCTS